MSKWQTLSSKEVYETPWMKVCRDEVLNHNGEKITYSVISTRHPSVMVVAVNSDGNILLQQNYRYTIDKTLWCLPAGHSDGEDLLAAAKRELLEEVGMVSDDWVMLGKLYNIVGIGNVVSVPFLARNVKHVSDKYDRLEDITNRKFFTPEEVESMIRSGEFASASNIAGIYQAKLHGLTKKEEK